MRRLSWSQYNMFTQCQLKYYETYILKVIPWGTSIHLQVGSATHAAIEASLTTLKNDKHLLSPVEMLAVFEKAMRKEGVQDPDTSQYWMHNMAHTISAWHKWAAAQDIRIVSLEEKVTKSNFLGIIDMVADINGVRFIVDWKTSGKPYTQKRVDADGQVTAYSWLVPCERVGYGVLVKGTQKMQFLESERTQDDVDTLLEDIAKMRETVAKLELNLQVPTLGVSALCDWCDVYKLGRCQGQDDF